MRAVLKARAQDGLRSGLRSTLLSEFDVVAATSSGIERVRQLVLDLAAQGFIVEQNSSDGDADALLQAMRARKAEMVAAGLAKRDKPLPPIAESEVPHSLPNGWRWTRLGDLLTKIGAGSTPLGGREVYTNTGVKFLRSQNVWNTGLSLADVAFIPETIHAKMSGTKVFAGDLLFNITGASIGRCAIVPDDFDEGNVSQQVTILRPAMHEMRQFLHLVLISARVQKTVMDVQVGVSREGLSLAKLSQFLVPIPPLAEQHRIVARVEELMKFCDALEQNGRLADEQHARLASTLFDALAASDSAPALAENWQRVAEHFDLLLDRPDAIRALEEAILHLAVRGALVPQKLGESQAPTSGRANDPGDNADEELLVPAGWRVVTLRDVCSVSGGSTPSKSRADFWDGDIPWVSPKDMKREVIADSIDHVTDAALAQTNLSLVATGSVLIVVRGMILAHSFPTAITSAPVTIIRT